MQQAETITASPSKGARARNYARHYGWFIVPAAVVVLAVIIFPWIFTIYVSAHDWHLGGERRWVGFDNYTKLFSDSRFGWAMLRYSIRCWRWYSRCYWGWRRL
jgi:multiple sugar transport system permease protein